MPKKKKGPKNSHTICEETETRPAHSVVRATWGMREAIGMMNAIPIMVVTGSKDQEW